MPMSTELAQRQGEGKQTYQEAVPGQLERRNGGRGLLRVGGAARHADGRRSLKAAQSECEYAGDDAADAFAARAPCSHGCTQPPTHTAPTAVQGLERQQQSDAAKGGHTGGGVVVAWCHLSVWVLL